MYRSFVRLTNMSSGSTSMYLICYVLLEYHEGRQYCRSVTDTGKGVGMRPN